VPETQQSTSSPTGTHQGSTADTAMNFSPETLATYGTELTQAYAYARQIGITTQDSIDDADMFGNLTRAQAAKMLSQFAIQVLQKQPDTTKSCTYPDIAGYGDLTERMQTACQLGIMGVNVKKFNPKATMTRAEFGTVLSRAIRGSTYDTTGTYYTAHLQQLQKS
jgi:hypothetical protein